MLHEDGTFFNTVFPELKYCLTQYRDSVKNEHLNSLDVQIWSIIMYVSNTNSSTAPCYCGKNFNQIKKHPTFLASNLCLSEVPVTQTSLALLGEKGERTVDANRHVFLYGGDPILRNIFLTQTAVALSSPPGNMHSVTQHGHQLLKINKSPKLSCHFSVINFGFVL